MRNQLQTNIYLVTVLNGWYFVCSKQILLMLSKKLWEPVTMLLYINNLAGTLCAVEYCNVLSSTRAVALMLAWFIVSHTCLAYSKHTM